MLVLKVRALLVKIEILYLEMGMRGRTLLKLRASNPQNFKGLSHLRKLFYPFPQKKASPGKMVVPGVYRFRAIAVSKPIIRFKSKKVSKGRYKV